MKIRRYRYFGTALLFNKIFNMSLASVLLPDESLESVVNPLFKAKSRYDPGNNCLVSFTFVCCKTMKKVLVSQLVNYLKLNALLLERLLCFHKSGPRSTEDLLVLVFSDVAGLVDDGLAVL